MTPSPRITESWRLVALDDRFIVHLYLFVHIDGKDISFRSKSQEGPRLYVDEACEGASNLWFIFILNLFDTPC